MFDPLPHPRVFGMPPGADFPAALVAHLQAAHADRPPQDLARLRLIVNTRRMARRIRDLFDRGPALLMPRVELITDLGHSHYLSDLPDAVSPLRRRLELVELISALLDAQPDLAPRAALYDLADSLAAVLDEMSGEGVTPEALEQLDVSDMSGHWDRALRFLTIARGFRDDGDGLIDPEARQRRVVEATVAAWAENPPEDPVILAGSTGSRGATNMLMRAVARLPLGALVLPGFDFDMPAHVWDGLRDPLKGEDHPQFRFARLLADLDLSPGQVLPWPGGSAPAPARNRAVSLALRPAPVTHQWMSEGPGLTGLTTAMQPVTLVEAPSARAEALAIALRLRQAAEDGQTAALITPDRMLTRQVSAALDRWTVVPDDSAGQPLQLSPPGRFLRHAADLFSGRVSAEALLTVLKHPLTHSGSDRGPHLLFTRRLELRLREDGPPFPDAATLRDFAADQSDPKAPAWAEWVIAATFGHEAPDPLPLADRVDRHMAVAERLAAGHAAEGSGRLWDERAGVEAARVVAELTRDAVHGGALSARDYATLFNAILGRGEVRDPDSGHPGILIWGTLEARVQGADLVILGGLNEGAWPELPPPDPWLNREMRQRVGMLVPERRVGLSAHDFQQAIGAAEVWLTRSLRSQDAETVPSRWISRLTNLLEGLPGEGRDAIGDMRERGKLWLTRARQLEEVVPVPRAARPSPCPPVAARPDKLSITQIKTLIRDPYAIYAREVLRLRPLNALMAEPDARLRGTVLHEVLETFVKGLAADPAALDPGTLLDICRDILARDVPWAEARLLWQARMAKVAGDFVEGEGQRRDRGLPAAFEVRGRTEIPELGFALTGKADRIDLDPAGNAWIYDYKTGEIASAKQQIHFDRQLLLTAAMLERRGFEGIEPRHVAGAAFIGVGSRRGEVAAPLDDVPPGTAWEDFVTLIRAYSSETQGFTSRRTLFSKDSTGDYDQLARFGEWDATAKPERRKLT
ncbi:MAG: double-strand break repair protein AddB [Pseudooceanicola sp.]